jgi:NAD(P)-dependent dehydrogenase (short-subunit alcohol dehydrogenase family)
LLSSFAWAIELADRRIRVNNIVPGPTETPGLAGLAANPAESERLLAEEAARVLLGRLGQPSEIATAALFLVSDEASFINRQRTVCRWRRNTSLTAGSVTGTESVHLMTTA